MIVSGLQFTEDIAVIFPILGENLICSMTVYIHHSCMHAGSLLAISIMIIMLLSSGIICNQIVKARKKSGSTSATSK